GHYEVESFEPYTLRYLKLIALEGDCSVSELTLRELKNPDAGRAQFASADQGLDRIFAAAQETFAQNAVDIFIRDGSDTPELAPAWMAGKLRDGEPICPQTAQCFGPDVSLGVRSEVSTNSDE
ncbi:MAG: hypothetical protein ABI222_18170, partial [Opitutaceae bacterium]